MSLMERNLAKLVELDGGDALPTNLLLEGKTPVDIADLLLDGLGMEPLNSVEPKALCECSEYKLLRSLRLLPREDVDEILREEVSQLVSVFVFIKYANLCYWVF